MNAKQINGFTHFAGIEEENVLINIANLGEDFFYIIHLDTLYMSCLNSEIDKKNLELPVFLYLISHNEFYIGMISFLRMHKTQSFRCLRAALDSVFTAYYLLKYPDKISLYLNKIEVQKNKEWNKIFLNIKRTIKKDIDNFPLAGDLLEIHEFCSIYAHSDALGILHKYDLDKERSRLEAKYFDYETTEDYKKWLAFLLFFFFKIFLIFWNEIFISMVGDKQEEIRNKIIEYKEKLQILMKKYPLEHHGVGS